MRQAGRRGLPGDDLVATTSAIIGILARFGWGWVGGGGGAGSGGSG